MLASASPGFHLYHFAHILPVDERVFHHGRKTAYSAESPQIAVLDYIDKTVCTREIRSFLSDCKRIMFSPRNKPALEIDRRINGQIRSVLLEPCKRFFITRQDMIHVDALHIEIMTQEELC